MADVVARVRCCLDVSPGIHLCQPTVYYWSRHSQPCQIRLFSRGQTVILIKVLHEWSAGASLQLCSSFGKEEEVSEYPAREKVRRWRWCDASSRRSRNQANEFKFREVHGVADFTQQPGKDFSLKIQVVPNFTDSSPGARHTKENVVSQNCRYSAVPVARSSSATAAGAEYAIINTTKPFHTFQFDKGAERDTPKNRMLRFGDSVSEKHGEIFGVLDRIFDIPAVVFICRSRQGITLREQRC